MPQQKKCCSLGCSLLILYSDLGSHLCMAYPTLAIVQPMAALLQGKGLVDGDGQSTRLPTKGHPLFFAVSHVENLEEA
jgi:hypothetical protein